MKTEVEDGIHEGRKGASGSPEGEISVKKKRTANRIFSVINQVSIFPAQHPIDDSGYGKCIFLHIVWFKQMLVMIIF